jgi:omega-amidase
MRVAMVEFEPAWEHPARNRQEFARAIPANSDVVVFPEMTFTGFTMNAVPDPDAEPFVREQAARTGTAIIAGHVAPGPRNRAVAVAADGSVLARYDKLHPFSFAGEDRAYRAGDDLPVFGIAGARAAMLICYDLRFPEPFREAALRGATLLVVPANWPARRIDHWHALLRARAIENQAFVVGVNRIGRDPHEEYVSSSCAIAPDGTILHEGAGTVEFDPAEADARTDRYRYPG